MISLWRQNTIRGKLTQWYILSTLGLFTVLTIFLSILIWQVLHEQIDHHIHIVVNEARQIVEYYPLSDQDLLLKQLVTASGMTVVVLKTDGTVVSQTSSPDVTIASKAELDKLIASSSFNSSAPHHFNANRQRFATVPVNLGTEIGLLAVGYSLNIINNAFRNLLAISMAILAFAFLLAIFTSRILLKKQLQPLERIADIAQSISGSQDLNKTIHDQNSTEEISQLSIALNTMILRLKAVFDKEHEFFSDAAHTIKTPLAVLRSQTETLKGEKKLALIQSIDRIVDNIQDLLLISRLETQSKQSFKKINLTKLMNELTLIGKTMSQDKKIMINSGIEAGIFITANRKLLSRALGNIVQNAVLYTPDNGTIEIKLFKQHKHSVIIVQDTGRGIAKEDLPYIFDRFFQGKNTRQSRKRHRNLYHSASMILALIKGLSLAAIMTS